MDKRYLLAVIFTSLAAGPALAQDRACYCSGSAQNVVTEKFITRTVVIDDCNHDPVCTAHGSPGYHWQPHHWHPRHPHSWHPVHPQPGPGHGTNGNGGSGGTTSGGTTSGGSGNIHSTTGGTTTTSGGSNSSSSSGAATSSGSTSTGSTSSGSTSSGSTSSGSTSSGSTSSGSTSTGSTSSGLPGATTSTGSTSSGSSGAVASPGSTSSGSSGAATASGSSSSGGTGASSASSGGSDIATLNQRVNGIDSWLGDLGWLAALVLILLLLAILLLVLLASRGTRHDSRNAASDARQASEAAAELQAELAQKDLEIARINDELAISRHDAERTALARTETIRTHSEHTEHHPASVIEEAELVAAGAVAGAAVAKPHAAAADTQTAAETAAETTAELHTRLRQRDLDMERLKDEMASLRRDLERQRDNTAHTLRPRGEHTLPPVETVVVVEDIAKGADVGAAVANAAHLVHHHASPKPPVHSVIDEADWSITHYRVVIGEARAQKHDRPHARAEVIRLSELMLAHYPDNAEAVSFARVSKAEALAEGGDHASALLECETVIAHYATATTPAVRTQLAHAHFVKAAIHAQHQDVAQCTAELDQWAKVYGIFDQRQVTEDVRFKDIITITEFQVYIAHKSR